jgi:hypothetical protein
MNETGHLAAEEEEERRRERAVCLFLRERVSRRSSDRATDRGRARDSLTVESEYPHPLPSHMTPADLFFFLIKRIFLGGKTSSG